MNETTAKRRRGAALQTEILEAAWEELAANGYAALTIDAVAKRAQTSRPVLYRRWADRSQLAVDAIQHYLDQQEVEVPDLGDIRQDMIALMRQYVDRGLPVVVLCALEMRDYYHETDSQPTDLRKKIIHGEDRALQEVILRAVQRKQIDGSKLTPRIISVTTDLLRHELTMTLTPPSIKTIEQIVDQIFLPLVRFDD